MVLIVEINNSVKGLNSSVSLNFPGLLCTLALILKLEKYILVFEKLSWRYCHYAGLK